jgi:hypothetical protein
MIRASVYEDLNEKQKVAVCDARFAKKVKKREGREERNESGKLPFRIRFVHGALDILFHSSRLMLAFPSFFHFCFLFLEPTSREERKI